MQGVYITIPETNTHTHTNTPQINGGGICKQKIDYHVGAFPWVHVLIGVYAVVTAPNRSWLVCVPFLLSKIIYAGRIKTLVNQTIWTNRQLELK